MKKAEIDLYQTLRYALATPTAKVLVFTDRDLSSITIPDNVTVTNDKTKLLGLEFSAIWIEETNT